MTQCDMKDKAQSAANAIKQSAESVMDDPKNEMVKSAKDWTNYIQTHPLQSLLFGLIGYFAIKGIVK